MSIQIPAGWVKIDHQSAELIPDIDLFWNYVEEKFFPFPVYAVKILAPQAIVIRPKGFTRLTQFYGDDVRRLQKGEFLTSADHYWDVISANWQQYELQSNVVVMAADTTIAYRSKMIEDTLPPGYKIIHQIVTLDDGDMYWNSYERQWKEIAFVQGFSTFPQSIFARKVKDEVVVSEAKEVFPASYGSW